MCVDPAVSSRAFPIPPLAASRFLRSSADDQKLIRAMHLRVQHGSVTQNLVARASRPAPTNRIGRERRTIGK